MTYLFNITCKKNASVTITTEFDLKARVSIIMLCCAKFNGCFGSKKGKLSCLLIRVFSELLPGVDRKCVINTATCV